MNDPRLSKPDTGQTNMTYRIGWKSGTIRTARTTDRKAAAINRQGQGASASDRDLQPEGWAGRIMLRLIQPSLLPPEPVWTVLLIIAPAAGFAACLWLAYRLLLI